MTLKTFDGVLYFFVALLLFIFTRRMLSNDILLLFHRITRSAKKSHQLHFLLVFPGVFLHELSHYAANRLMGVPSSLHFGVEMGVDTVVYGHVDFYERDITPLKHFITGIAPLLIGLLCAALLAVGLMGVPSIGDLIRAEGKIAIELILAQANHWSFWLAFYFLFAITSEMLPSDSDRTYWLPVAGILIALILLSVITNTFPWLLNTVYPYLNNGLKFLAILFAICLTPQLILLIPLRLLRWLTMPKHA